MEQVEAQHRDFASALKESEEIELTVTGRISGRRLPVRFGSSRRATKSTCFP